MTTDWILIGIALFLAGWEVWTLVNKTPGDHITARVREMTAKWPLLPFLLGVLVGHLWW